MYIWVEQLIPWTLCQNHPRCTGLWKTCCLLELQASSCCWAQIPQCPIGLNHHSDSQIDSNCATDDGFDRERIVFVHLPKTGGTSFRYWLQDHFEKGDRSWQYKSLRVPKGWGPGMNTIWPGLQQAMPTKGLCFKVQGQCNSGHYHQEPHLSFYKQWKSLSTFNARLYYGDSLQEAQAFLENRVSLLGIYDCLSETLWLARDLLPWLGEVPFPNENKGSRHYTKEISRLWGFSLQGRVSALRCSWEELQPTIAVCSIKDWQQQQRDKLKFLPNSFVICFNSA